MTLAETPRNFIRSHVVDQVERAARAGRRARGRYAAGRAPTPRPARGTRCRPRARRRPRAPSCVQHRGDRRLEPDLGAVRLGGPGQHLREAAVAALVERPRAEVAVVLAHLVEQQHQAGAGRHRPDLRADDRGGGVEALDRLVLEVVVEPVRGAAGEQPDRRRASTWRSTPPRWSSSHRTSAWSSGSLPKTSGGALSNSGWIAWQTRSRSWW